MNNKLLKALAISSALLVSSQVSAAHLNLVDVDVWGIDVTGSGDTNNITYMNRLDYDGSSFADSTIDQGDPTFIDAGDTFVDYGYLFSTGGNYNGGNADFGDHIITTVFDNWTGTYTNTDPLPLEYDFETGDLTWTVWDTDINGDIIPGTNVDILTFSIVEGSSTHLFGNNYVINLTFELSAVLADNFLFYDLDGDGILEDDEDMFDLATLVDDEGNSKYYSNTLSFVQVADSPATQDATKTTIEDAYDLYGIDLDLGQAIGVAATNDGNLTVSQIPEPGMLSLMGLAFLGLAGFQRRRKES